MYLFEDLVELPQAFLDTTISRFRLAISFGVDTEVLYNSATPLTPNSQNSIGGQGNIHVKSLISFDCYNFLELVVNCVNQDERESSSPSSIAVGNPASSTEWYFALLIALNHFADAVDLIPLVPINEIAIVYVALVVVDLAVLVTSVEVLEVVGEGYTSYWSAMVLDSMDKVSLLVAIFEFKHSHRVVHIAACVQIVLLPFIVIVLLKDVVEPICHVVVP